MASLCRQIVRTNAFKGLLWSTARRGYADTINPPYDPGSTSYNPGAPPVPVASPDPETSLVMPDPMEHATGLEKKELQALQSGNDDPFNMKVLKKAAGTRDSPTLVPSCFDARIVGCVCEEHSTSINWLWVHKDHPRRCECGHWYKLIEKTPL